MNVDERPARENVATSNQIWVESDIDGWRLRRLPGVDDASVKNQLLHSANPPFTFATSPGQRVYWIF